jgi:ribonuclease BN (tRNA processing enzyme)
MEIQFVGSGDAFGSGGRFNTCFMVTAAACRFLIDCGASSLVALRHHGIDPNSIDGVVVSHLHGDHFGGLPFYLLDAQLLSRRKRPFFLFGPPGLAARLKAAQEVLFPGSSETPLRFALEIVELQPEQRHAGPGFAVTPFLANHQSGAPSFSLRIECEERVVTYSGDTAWTDTLLSSARGADLFICECCAFERPLRGHLDYATLAPRLPEIGAKRVVITHMNPDMLERRHAIPQETAEDGLVITL